MRENATNNMNTICDTILSFPVDAQNRFFASIADRFTASELKTLQAAVALRSIMTDTSKYDAVKAAVADMVFGDDDN